MGTAPISKLSTAQPEVPARPYKRNKPRRRGLFSLRKNYCEPRTLVQLILLQDWQKVLVRAKLYPHEISQFISTEINGTPLQILPLHLVCALDPPVAVVTLFLKLNPQATMAPVNAHHPKNTESNTSSRRRKNKGLRKFSSMKSITSGSTSPKPSLPHLFRQARRQRSEPSISIFEHSDDLAIAGELQEQSLLNRETVPSRKNVPRWGAYYKNFEPSDCEDSTSLRGKDSEEYPQPQPVQSDLESPSLVESFSSYSMASSSRQSASLLDHRGTILQLSPSGSVTPFPISSRETDSTSETYSQAPPTGKSSPLFDVRWDLTPLLGASVVSEKSPDNSILPIHICILYHASPAVVRAIVENNPAGAVASALGMLPIHMVSAGWRMEPIVPKLPPLPESIESDKNGSTAKGIPLQRYHCQQEHHPSRVKEILTILCKAIPDSTRIRSGQHGMTPAEYVAESMQGESQREECLRLLQPLDEDKDKEQPVEYCRLEGPLEKLTEMASTNP